LFSTVLKQATDLFDKRTVSDALLPMLAGWSVAVAAIAAVWPGWGAAAQQWETLGATKQTIAIAFFLAWVVLWTFVLLAFRIQLTRAFEGYWPSRGPFGYPLRWRRGAWQRWRDRNQARDAALGNLQGLLLDEVDRWRQIVAGLLEKPVDEGRPSRYEPVLWKFEKDLRSATERPTDGNIYNVKLISEELEAAFGSRAARATSTAASAASAIARAVDETVATRALLDAEFFTLFTGSRGDVMATRLGNVLRAAEAYGRERYGLDSVTIWPRLYPSLPAAFVADFADADSALAQMITLCFEFLGFGLAVAVIMAVHPPKLLATLASSAGLSTLVGPIAFIATALVSLLFATVCYRGAVQAAIGYGTKIRSAIDLYRGSVLDGLKIEQPRELEDERRTWEQVSRFLYRGDPPRVAVTRRPVSAFQTLTSADMVENPVELPNEATGGLADLMFAIGKAPVVDLAEGQAIRRHQLVESDSLKGRVVVAIQPVQSMLPAEIFRPGDKVDVVIFSEDGGVQRKDEFKDVLLLWTGATVSSNQTGSDHLVALGIPAEQRDLFIARSIAGKAVIAKRFGC
jgi:hypothetical protein